jgi:hypothetical protein
MITLIILFSLVLSAGFALLNRRRTTAIAIAAALVAFEAVGSGLIPSLLLETLQSRSIVRDNPAWGERNVIIVLGDGTVRYHMSTSGCCVTTFITSLAGTRRFLVRLLLELLCFPCRSYGAPAVTPIRTSPEGTHGLRVLLSERTRSFLGIRLVCRFVAFLIKK